jgi:hypothetical protein
MNLCFQHAGDFSTLVFGVFLHRSFLSTEPSVPSGGKDDDKGENSHATRQGKNNYRFDLMMQSEQNENDRRARGCNH